MTEDQLNQLANLISRRIIEHLDYHLDIEPVKRVMSPEEFFDHQVDAFGNIKNIDRKYLIEQQLAQLEETKEKLLKEEKYELLKELKEIYDKLKKEYENL